MCFVVFLLLCCDSKWTPCNTSETVRRNTQRYPSLTLTSCPALTHMLIIPLIWQEVYKWCQHQCSLHHSVMVAHLYLGVTILALVATSVANTGILCECIYSQLTSSVVFKILKLALLQIVFRYQCCLWEGLCEDHMEDKCRVGAVCSSSLPWKLHAVQTECSAQRGRGSKLQLQACWLQI